MRVLRQSLALGLVSLLGVAACRSKAEGAGEDGASATTSDKAEKVEPATNDERPTSEQLVERLRLDERAFPLLIWSIAMVELDYFDKSRFDPKGQIRAAVEYLGLHTPEFFAAIEGDNLKVTVRAREQDFSLAQVGDLGSAADLLEQVIAFTAEVLSLEGEPLHELEYAAINGFLGPLDPHTILLTPEENAELGVKTRGHFGGIGAEINSAERMIRIARVLPDSPAMAAGIQDGDLLVQIAGQSTVNMSVPDAQQLLRGPVDTEVTVKVRRDKQLLTITIKRGLIRIPAVRSVMLPERVGYIQVATFQEDTAAKLKEALEQFQKDGELAGLVIDLRGNSGGLLTQAVEILDQVVTGGELVIVHSALGREHREGNPDLVVPLEVPIIALVDEQAASASEIVGGSLKHLDRALILGRSSFGKGTVQELHKATPYGREVALKLTIAEYRVAGDRKIQTIGVIPDLQLLPVGLSSYEGVAAMYDLERFERERERARILHLPSAVHEEAARAEAAITRPKLSLRYFLGAAGQTNEPVAGGENPAPRELDDPEIRLARDVALGLRGQVGRKAQLDALPDIVARLADGEAERIRQGMASWQIDWSPVDDPQDGATPLELALAITEVKAPLVPVDDAGAAELPLTRAGQPFRLHVEVRNPSERTLEQVHLITDCARDELDGIEVLIGRLAPGETVSRDLDLAVSAWHGDFIDTIELLAHVGEPDDEPDGRAELSFAIAGDPRPLFSYDYWIIDDPRLAASGPKRPKVELLPGEQPFTVQGNGDGLLQAGERVLLAFRAHNAGGEAPDARVLLRNLSGTQGLLEEGLVAHGPLASNREFTGAFGITISPNADPALPLELELIVGDAVLRESVEDKLRFRIIPGRDGVVEVEGERRRAVEGDEPLRIYNGADASSAVIGELAPGSVVNVDWVAGDWLGLAGPKGQGRRLWIPADRVAVGGSGSVVTPALAGRLVDPPRIELSPVPEQVAGDDVTIVGAAVHRDRVRDVVILVQGAAPGQPQRKVFYRANPELEGPAAQRLEFSAEVPLVAGSNVVTVIVRDHDKVERRRELWVYAGD